MQCSKYNVEGAKSRVSTTEWESISADAGQALGLLSHVSGAAEVQLGGACAGDDPSAGRGALRCLPSMEDSFDVEEESNDADKSQSVNAELAGSLEENQLLFQRWILEASSD